MKARKWGNKESAVRLMTDMHRYAAGAAPFDAACGGPGFDPINWWRNNKAPEAAQLRQIALYSFELVPTAANPERVFSTLGYFQEQRPLLSVVNSLELVRIKSYHQQNPPTGEVLQRAQAK
jgi:hypothetical protein